jgi:hypothetical protein
MSNPFTRPGPLLTPAAAAGRPPADEEFGAPIGTRVRWSTRLVLGAMVAFIGFDAWLAFSGIVPSSARWVLLIVPWLALGIVGGIAWYSRVLGFRLAGGELVARRPNRETRFELAGLEAVEADPKAMDWSIKTFGNDGLGAITGHFRNRKLGAYEALVTDRERTVVLRWPKRCLVVSPDRPEEFARAVRARVPLPR